jgi:hypothetical protein
MVTLGEYITGALGDLPQLSADSLYLRPSLVVISVQEAAIARAVTHRYANQNQLEAMR